MIDNLKQYPAMKDSGVSWLGQVPGHWEVLPNRALFTEVKDRDHPDEEMLSVTITRGIVKQKTLLEGSSKKDSSNLDKSAYKLVQPRDIAYNKMRAWQGAIGASALRGIISPAYVVMRLRNAHDLPSYFHHLYRTPQFAKEAERWSYGITSDMWSLRPEHFKMIYTAKPPPDEQAAIVRFLDWANGRLERAIRVKRKVIALLGEQKQAIVHRAVTRGLDPSVPLKPSGIPWLGDIPQHWQVRRLKTISPRIGVGLVINPSSYFVDEGHPHPVPMLLGNNIVPNGFRLSKVRHISADDNRRLGASRLTAGDVVVVRVGAPGVAAVVPASLDGCNCASVMIVRKHHSFLPQWLAHAFNSPVVASQIDVVKYGAAQKQFNIGHAVDFLFPVPPMEEQRAVVESIGTECAPVDTAISRLEREIELLREYRTRLVADVVTGKLDVREAAAQLPDEAPLDSVEDAADLGGEIESEAEEIEA